MINHSEFCQFRGTIPPLNWQKPDVESQLKKNTIGFSELHTTPKIIHKSTTFSSFTADTANKLGNWFAQFGERKRKSAGMKVSKSMQLGEYYSFTTLCIARFHYPSAILCSGCNVSLLISNPVYLVSLPSFITHQQYCVFVARFHNSSVTFSLPRFISHQQYFCLRSHVSLLISNTFSLPGSAT